MSKRQYISFYPYLSSAVKVLGIQFTPFSFYSSLAESDPLSESNTWPGPVVFGGQGDWDQNKHDLQGELKVIVRKPKALFGPNGYACSNAEICMILEWFSKESNQRGQFDSICFRSNTDTIEHKFNFSFGQAEIRKKAELQFKFVISIPDENPGYDEKHIANTAGVIIGETETSCVLNLEGSNTLFPVIERESLSPNDPLWRLNYNSTNASLDPFDSDYIALELNPAHPDYQGIFLNEYKSPLLKELISSWIAVFLTAIREREFQLFEKLRSGVDIDDMEKGSIAYFASYFIQTFNIHLETTEDIFYSISKSMEKQFR